MMDTRIRTFIILLSATYLCGCSIFYSETRHTQSKDIRTALDKLDFESQVKVPRENRVKLLEKQIAISNAISDVVIKQNVTAASLSTESVEKFFNKLADASEVELSYGNLEVGAKDEMQSYKVFDGKHIVADDFHAKQSSNRSKRVAQYKDGPEKSIRITANASANLARIARVFLRNNVPMPECVVVIKNDEAYKKALSTDDPKAQVAIDGEKADLAHYCKEVQDSSVNLANFQDTISAIDSAKTELSELDERTKVLRAQIEGDLVAAEGFQKKISDPSKPPKDKDEENARQELSQAAHKLSDSFDKLKLATDAFSIDFLSSKKEEALNDFLSDLKSNNPKEPFSNKKTKAGLVYILFPSLADELRKHDAEIDASTWGKLAIEKDIARLQGTVAKREQAILSARIKILEQNLALEILRAGLFYKADRIIESLGHYKDTKIADVLNSDDAVSGDAKMLGVPLEVRAKILRALAYYIDGAGRVSGELSKNTFRLNALSAEKRLMYSEINVHQWKTLIDANVASLEQAGNSGLKAETVNGFVNSIALFWIGARVK